MKRSRVALTVVPKIEETEPTGHEWTLAEAASQIGIHRVTLLRMHQREVIPKARWRRKNATGNPYRVYSAAEIASIKAFIERERADKDRERIYVD